MFPGPEAPDLAQYSALPYLRTLLAWEQAYPARCWRCLSPVLLIAGGDKPDEGYAGRDIRSASPATVDLWIVPNTGHTAALDTHPSLWEHNVTTFLANAFHLGEIEPTP